MRCRDVMKKVVVSCHEGDSVTECARLMQESNIGFLPVIDAEGQVSGVVTDRDLALRVVGEMRDGATPVSAIMTRDVRVCRPEDDIRAAERKMAAVRKSRLAVVDARGHCVGVISLSDVAQVDTRARAGHVLYEITQRESHGPVPLLPV
jgi:CBS domain-containing protein